MDFKLKGALLLVFAVVSIFAGTLVSNGMGVFVKSNVKDGVEALFMVAGIVCVFAFFFSVAKDSGMFSGQLGGYSGGML